MKNKRENTQYSFKATLVLMDFKTTVLVQHVQLTVKHVIVNNFAINVKLGIIEF